MLAPILVIGGLFFLAAAVLACVAGADDRPSVPEQLIGGYQIISGEESGQKVPEERLRDNKVRIAADSIVVSDKGGKELYVAKYHLDTEREPYGIAMTTTGSPRGERGSTAKGLLKMEGDTVWLIYAYDGGEEPTEFTTKPDSKQNLFVMKRTSGQ